MATLNLSFETGSVPLSKINNAIALEFNYQENIPDIANPGQTIPNPETKSQFSKRMIGNIIKSIVKNQDLIPARITAEAGVSEISLI